MGHRKIRYAYNTPSGRIRTTDVFSSFNISDKNYWVSEDKQIEMMENIEFLCQAFDSIKLADINKQLNDLETDKQADFVVQTIDDHKQKETARTEALNEKLKVDKAKDTIKSGGWSVNDVQLVCSRFSSQILSWNSELRNQYL